MYQLSICLQRSDKKSIQHHLFVGRFSDRCWDLVKEEMKRNKLKASTFVPLRTLTESETYASLVKFKDNAYDKRFLKKQGKTIKSKVRLCVKTDVTVNHKIKNEINVIVQCNNKICLMY